MRTSLIICLLWLCSDRESIIRRAIEKRMPQYHLRRKPGKRDKA